MKILMVASEVAPFVRTGGLADVVTALSKVLDKQGHEVKIVLPRYYVINREQLELLEGPMGVPLGFQEVWTAVYKSRIPESNVSVYFIDHEQSYGREGIYGSSTEPDYADNPLRYSLLCHSAFQLCRKLDWFPDVIHAHDWQGALAAILPKYTRQDSKFDKTATVFTVHNMGYQGVYGKHCFPHTGISWEYFYAAGFEDWDRMNFLKAGLVSADVVTTVSPTYAKEIQTPEYGFRMDGVLRFRSDTVRGILNGIDKDSWNPAKDKFIPAKYSVKTLEKKAENKKALQEAMGLPVTDKVPLIGIISRLTDQKGVAELFGPSYGCVPRICNDMKVQFAVLGQGERWCENELRVLSSNLPNLKASIKYDEKLSHLIEAGSDFYLMPSRYEPCGLNQMYSLLYGTLPIVHKTGGLNDTVENYNEETGDGTGFALDVLSPQSVYDTVGWAVFAWYNKKDHIRKMQERGMKKDFSWERAGKEYEKVYEQALKIHNK